MYILARFKDNGVPKTGLSPIIKIRDIPNGNVIIDNENMSELGDGGYYYNFVDYDSTKDYAIFCDGTAVLSDGDRYFDTGNENYVEDIDNVLNNNDTLKRLLGLMHENIYIDQTIYDAHGNLSSARVRIYSNSASVGTDTDVIGTYTITSNSSETGKFNVWKQVAI